MPQHAASLVARLGPRDHVTPTLKHRQWLPVEQRIVFKLCLLMLSSSYWTNAILSSQLRHRISRHHFTSSSALHQQSTLRTAAHARAGSVSVFSSVFQKSVSVSVFQNIAISVSVFGFPHELTIAYRITTIADTLRPPLSPEWGYGPSNLHYKLRP